MLAELDQITSILSNVCVILITAWLVNKSWQFKTWMVKSWQFKTWQFKKNISYYIKMTQHVAQPSVDQLAVAQPDVDQIDQLLLDAADVQAGDAQLDDITKMKEKLIQVVAGGKSRRYLGKLMTMKEIEQLDYETVKKLYARYEATLGGLITRQLKKHMCYAYSRAVRFICPTLNFEVKDIVGLSTSLNEGPFIDLALSSLTCKLYHEYGHLLVPIEAAIITSSHLTPLDAATKLLPAEAEDLAKLEELKPELKPENY